MTCISSLLSKRERTVIHQLFKPVVIEILALPWAIVITFALLSGALVSLAGLPGTEFALGFILKIAGPVAVFQSQLLLTVVSIGALCFIIGRFRIEALVLHLAHRLDDGIPGLKTFWSLMRSVVSAPFYLIETGGIRPINLKLPDTLTAEFVYGDTPQLE